MNRMLLWCVLLLVWLGACAPTVAVEQRPGTDFSQYRTFAWAETEVKTENPNPLLASPLAQTTIREAIEREMLLRGLQRAESNPDFFLTTHFYVEEAERTVANPPGPPMLVTYPYLVRYRGLLLPVNYSYWYRPLDTGYRTERYREGTLVIDIIDAKTNNLVWRGSVANPINNPARLGRQFAKAARDILEKFPKAKPAS
ncbi:DUF4136 domain-containing protein [Hymenobacter sp. BT683]|uniref:DUF4136 domain-containing protein n=1 Tax=Hymenobacter jeongseonensis TaxID=2791027 RepID=A0ABS0IDB5_9BACT|nr:DUF4136 domain-containing protein [Hymenobacter jeongseonensis]MBF9236339.1 DUF4136 domain-containing protein [Hymenobacter jeongseonensis]